MYTGRIFVERKAWESEDNNSNKKSQASRNLLQYLVEIPATLGKSARPVV